MRSPAARGLLFGVFGLSACPTLAWAQASQVPGAPATAPSYGPPLQAGPHHAAPHHGHPPPPGAHPPHTSPPPSSLEAGGLRPPGALQEEQAGPTEVEQDLARADEEDSGRGLQFVWLNAEVGYQYVDLGALSGSGLLPSPEAVDALALDPTQSGLSFGGGAGVRLLYFTFGARFRYGAFSQFDLWSLLGEAGFRIPYGNFEPYVNVGAGYVTLTSIDAARQEATAGAGSLQIRGVDVRMALGFDYHLSDTFSVGPQLGADLLLLSRPGVAGAPGGAVYAADGSSVGLSLQASLVLGLHF